MITPIDRTWMRKEDVLSKQEREKRQRARNHKHGQEQFDGEIGQPNCDDSDSNLDMTV